MDNNTFVIPGENLVEKLIWLNSNVQSNGNYIIEVNTDENIDTQYSSLSYSDKSNIIITIKGIGSNKIISLSSKGNLFKVGLGVTLILDNNITLRGINNNEESLVEVSGTLVMNDGSAITNNTNRRYGNLEMFTNAGGVQVWNTGTFIMNGGIISGNTSSGGCGLAGGGVSVCGTFTMKGGTISGNTSLHGGGVNVAIDSSFIMEGGTISGNKAQLGGGVCIQSEGKTFVKTGGTITGYASDTVNGNVVIINGRVADYSWSYNFGHAIICFINDNNAKCKDTTAGPTDNMSYTDGNFIGVWDGKTTASVSSSNNDDSDDSSGSGCGCGVGIAVILGILGFLLSR